MSYYLLAEPDGNEIFDDEHLGELIPLPALFDKHPGPADPLGLIALDSCEAAY